MYNRFLFVGLGGSGGKTLRYLKKELLQWQQQHGIDDPLPKGWQFLNIDTPQISDGRDIDEFVEPLAPDEYLGLIDKNLQFSAVQGHLDTMPEFHEAMATWRLDPAGVNVPLNMGAGQFRAIGQTVAMSYASRIQQKLREYLSRLQGTGVQPELGKLFQQATGMAPAQESGIYTVVVSSLAGGSGAGLLNLVCDLLRADGTTGDKVFGLLYTPDVFEAIGVSATGGVHPNALAATSELMNGYWRRNSSPTPTPVLTHAGVGRLISGSGPSFPFLVGRRNADGVDFGTHDRTFEVTGRSLVSWVTASAAQSGLVPYTIGNWEMNSKNNNLGPILVDEGGQDSGHPQFSALGFARVSVGADYFETYTKLLLARDANEHLANYHANSEEALRVAKSLSSSDPELISHEIAVEQRNNFLHRAGLSESGPDENQIIEALRPDDALDHEMLERARDLSGVGGDSKQPLDDWRAEIDYGVAQAQEEYLKEYKSQLEDLATKWADSIQEQLLEAVEVQVATRGLHVARSLCVLAAEQLTEDVVPELGHDGNQRREWHKDWKRAFRGKLEHLSGSIEADHEDLDDALKEAVHLAKFVGEEILNERCAELCTEIADRLLLPLAAALSAAHAAVSIERRQLDSWPAWDAPTPKDLRPPPGELTLIDDDKYPEHFRELMERSFTEKPVDERRDRAREAVISGSFLINDGKVTKDDYRKLRCLSVQQNWWPSVSWRNPAKRLAVEVQTGRNDLSGRASRWLRRQGTPFARFLDLNLRSYLGSDALYKDDMQAKELEANTTRFITQLNAAMRESAPLVDIDAALLGRVHPDNPADSHTRYFSQIPLQGHRVEEEVSRVLEAGGVKMDKISEILGNDASVTHIDITSTLHSPHSVLVMKSLMGPIAGAWNRAKGRASARYTFWDARRGQPLENFVPVPQPLLLCMLRGWFTGVLLGHIDSGEGDRPVRISWPGPRDSVDFPYPFLTSDSDPLAKLGQVLEALPLAYVEVGHSAELAPLNPYIALRDLGKSADDLSDYPKLNSVLQAWVSSGTCSGSIVEPHRMIEKIDKGIERASGRDESHQRADELAKALEVTRRNLQERYEKAQQNWAEDFNQMSKAPLWTGLWHPISFALQQLSDACNNAARRLTFDDDGII